jgi:uncharacterized protein (TIGR02391 family)
MAARSQGFKLMAKRSTPQPEKKPANLPARAVPEAIRKLERRRQEFEDADPENYEGNLNDLAQTLCSKLDATLIEIFGPDTLECKQTRVDTFAFAVNRLSIGPRPRHELIAAFRKGQETAKSRIKARIELLSERLEDSGETSTARALRAYEGLSLHFEIDRAAGDLYRNGHYANAIVDAVKALNAIVRLRSGVELDGMALMERVFNPGNPVLKFNDLQTQSDRDEQKGFMLLFSGAVAGLRNPRAHAFIHDDPERALEFIAFVSLLAKLLDGTKKG